MAGKLTYIQGSSNAAIAASTTKTIMEAVGTAARMLGISRVAVSQDTHKTSEQYEVFVQNMTTTGTGTAFTPLPKEPGAGAAAYTAKVADSIEPTYTASTIRYNARWNSLTGKDKFWPQGTETWIAPSASAGFGIYVTTPASTTSFSPIVEADVIEFG